MTAECDTKAIAGGGSTVSEVELSPSSAPDKIVSHMDDGENVLR